MELYNGLLSLKRSDGAKAAVHGGISYIWKPTTRIEWWAESDDWEIALDANAWELAVEVAPIPGNAAPVSRDGTYAVFGWPLTVLETGDRTARVKNVIFNVVNGPIVQPASGTWLRGEKGQWIGRVTLVDDEWMIDLDLPEDHRARSDYFRRTGGSVFTHIGVLRRRDKRTFTQQQADVVLEDLSYVLAFNVGRNVGLDLPAGRDWRGSVKWRRYNAQRTSGGSPFTWSDPLDIQHFTALWKRWRVKVRSHPWDEVLRRAIHFWVAANDPKPVELAITDGQAGLELMAWVELTYEQGRPEKDVRNPKMNAAGRIRELLAVMNVPPGIPPELGALSAQAVVSNWQDGPEALTYLRNRMMHPKHTDPRFSVDVWIECWQLGQWYLDLSILHRLEFRGRYHRRTKKTSHVGDTESVPWAAVA